jgi:hypothetical protein
MKRSAPKPGHLPEDKLAIAVGGAAGPIVNRLPGRRVTAMMLLAAAALDLTRCGLVAATARQPGPSKARHPQDADTGLPHRLPSRSTVRQTEKTHA